MFKIYSFYIRTQAHTLAYRHATNLYMCTYIAQNRILINMCAREIIRKKVVDHRTAVWCLIACVRAIHRRRTDQVWQVFFDRRRCRAATRTRVRYTFFYFIHTHCGAAHHLYNYKNYACAQTNRFNDCRSKKKTMHIQKYLIMEFA